MRINRTLGAGRVLVALFLLSFLAASAQQPVSLDSCRRMALKNNKQLRIAEEKVKGAGYTKKSARGAYFPGIDFSGTYMYNQKSISLLEEDQYLPTKSFDLATQEYKYNVVTNPMTGEPILNNGQPIPQTVALIPKEAFEFDVHNVYVGLVTLTQPIFMGGKIKALNDIASYAEKLAVTQRNTAEKEIVYQTDEAYWQVVSLVHKKRLAESYTALLDTLNRHVQDMIEEGGSYPVRRPHGSRAAQCRADYAGQSRQRSGPVAHGAGPDLRVAGKLGIYARGRVARAGRAAGATARLRYGRGV